ncbi:MarR family winged helix-turn-helix transcriptional regulator [Streptomyces sp. NPDC006711]|uniref:MarR family winged helix-turn-helix transcriptional regulator n=1 Tax=Streptomyces sp. NPDC006711 TaxID=3364762 RepID=UPI00369F4D2D
MHSTHRSLPQLLTEARRWFEEGLLTAMEATGATPVSPTQAQLFAVLDEDGTTVSELARRMGVTRQTAHQAVHGLVGAGLLVQSPDPDSARRRLIRRTPEGEHAHRRATAVLDRLEEDLAERIGRDTVDALRAALETPWGEPPTPRRPGHPVRPAQKTPETE